MNTQTAHTTTRAYVTRGEERELVYECKGYTNIEELRQACQKYADEHGFTGVDIVITED